MEGLATDLIVAMFIATIAKTFLIMPESFSFKKAINKKKKLSLQTFHSSILLNTYFQQGTMLGTSSNTKSMPSRSIWRSQAEKQANM